MSKKKVKREREKQIKFFVNEKEFSQIEAKMQKAKSKNKSDYIRNCALNKKIISIDGLKELALEVSRIGNNINQISRGINAGTIKDTGELKQYKIKYEEVMDEILRISKLVK